MRRASFDRPFIEGMVTDQPAYKLGPRQSVYAQDLIAPNGIATQRKGWAYDGTTADVADNLVGIWRNKFLLSDATRTLTVDDDGDFFVHNASAAGTNIDSNSAVYLPRCVYKDQLILCAQDGQTMMRLWSGAATTARSYSSGSPTWTSGRATVSGTNTFASNTPVPGEYANVVNNSSVRSPFVSYRILEATSDDSITLEDVLAGATLGVSSMTAAPIGFTWPCVSVYNAGTVSVSSGTATGHGTKWTSGDWGAVNTNDGFLPLPSGASTFMLVRLASPTDTSATTDHGDVSGSAYHIMRRCPFRDAQAHKGSLWGTGVAQYPNHVYVSPPNWNPCLPPGAVPPFDGADVYESQNANDFFLDSIPVPTAYEGDVNVAILSTPNPLLVLKRSAVYGIFGAYPNFSVDKIADGVGCIDLRSAISGPNGQFWAGEDGIYAYVGGQVIDLTNGKINREWRSLTDDFDYGTNDYCAIGESNDHLLVSIVTAGGTVDRTYVYDLRNQAWISRFSNHKARYFFSSKVDGEKSELYWVGDNDQGRVMKSSMVFDGTGLAKDGDGTSPRLQAWTGSTADGTESVDNDARLLDLSISHNVYDAGAAGSTQMAVSVVSGGSLESNADSTKTLADINSDATDRIDRTRYRHVNAKGRHHQIRVDVDTLGTNTAATKIEIPEIAATVRDRRSRT